MLVSDYSELLRVVFKVLYPGAQTALVNFVRHHSRDNTKLAADTNDATTPNCYIMVSVALANLLKRLSQLPYDFSQEQHALERVAAFLQGHSTVDGDEKRRAALPFTIEAYTADFRIMHRMGLALSLQYAMVPPCSPDPAEQKMTPLTYLRQHHPLGPKSILPGQCRVY
jgi:hypothetical protein